MKNWIIFLAFLQILSGCTAAEESGQTCMQAAYPGTVDPVENFFEQVDKIWLVPLESGDDILIGAGENLVVYKNDFFIIKNFFNGGEILRFDNTGKFLNRIGARGRGPGEYVRANNIQIKEDSVLVYSAPDFTVKYYNLAGKFLKESVYGECPDGQGYKYGENFLIYNGFGGKDKHRVFLLDQKREIVEKYLNTEGDILPMGEVTDIFNPYGEDIYIREAFADTVYRYAPAAGKMSPYIAFDFGPYALGEDFYRGKGAMEKMEKIMARPFVSTVRYLENDRIRILETIINNASEDRAQFLYAVHFKNQPSWQWYEFGPDAGSGLSGIFRTCGKNTLYCMINPDKLELLKERAGLKIENPQVLERLEENDNPVVAVFTFRK